MVRYDRLQIKYHITNQPSKYATKSGTWAYLFQLVQEVRLFEKGVPEQHPAFQEPYQRGVLASQIAQEAEEREEAASYPRNLFFRDLIQQNCCGY